MDGGAHHGSSDVVIRKRTDRHPATRESTPGREQVNLTVYREMRDLDCLWEASGPRAVEYQARLG